MTSENWQDMLPCDKPQGHPSTFEAECKQLRAEIEVLTKSGIIEVAVRNPSVADYMRHWEGRAEKAEARVAELEAKIDQMHGLADEGCTAPNAAYRWCERIDEVATHGAQEEYAQYAMSSKRAARPSEATTDPL